MTIRGNRPVALVTAGARGLGRAVTDALIASGYRVLVTTSRAEGVRLPADNARLLVTDLQDKDDAGRAVSSAIQAWGSLHLLVNNLGPYLEESVAHTKPESFDHVVRANLAVPFGLAAAAIPFMRAGGGGTIINIGAVGAGAARGWRRRGAYMAAKSGLASLTRTIAREERRHGIAAMMVSPSNIEDPDKEMAAPSTWERPPMGGDVARLVVFLADPASFYLSGNVIELMRRPPSTRH